MVKQPDQLWDRRRRGFESFRGLLFL